MICAIEPLPADEATFTALAERHRRELHLHCYRMLACVQDAEDAVQETLLRAWRSRATFAGRSTFRAWLYRIATNVALDVISRRPAVPAGAFEVPWLEPYPDDLLAAAAAEQPEAVALTRETIELAFIVAVQQVPPQGRAALLLRDVLGWSAVDSAALLDVSVAALNSSLQRARAVLEEHLPPDREAWSAEYEGQERELVERYVDVHEHRDEERLLALLAENVRWAMPPYPESATGREALHATWREGGFWTPGFGELRCVLTRANAQPAVAVYRRRDDEPDFRPLAVNVVRMAGGVVAEILTFSSRQFAALDLPVTPC